MTTSIRDAATAAAHAVQEARRRHLEAQEAARAAGRAVQEAEREAARAASEWQGTERELVTEARRRLTDLMAKVAAASDRADGADQPIASATRARARHWLHPGSHDDPVNVGGPGLLRLTEDDRLVALWRELSLEAGGFNVWMLSAGLVDDELHQRADELDCRCWRECMRRVRVLAGEEEQP